MSNAVSQAFVPLEDFPMNDGMGNHQRSGAYRIDLTNLAHEIRQPLSTIEALAYYLQLTAADDRLCQHLEQIRHLVNKANRILDHAVAS